MYNTKINPNKTDDGQAKGRLKILRKERKISKQIPNSLSAITEMGLPMGNDPILLAFAPKTVCIILVKFKMKP
ncbi:MAG: hypothetical protein ABS44_09650 [Chryseobacterium sp. SCN 40-13]|nr:MAG: hypothetical protein ABS44_09650 [Chryseobacterium sp. SCN 40-13]